VHDGISTTAIVIVRRFVVKSLLGFTITIVSIIIIFPSFFPNEVYRTNMTYIQVWTPSGPKYTDPLSATLTHFSRSQTHF